MYKTNLFTLFIILSAFSFSSCAKPPIYKNRFCTVDGRCTEEQVRVVNGEIIRFQGQSWSRCKGTKCEESMEYSTALDEGLSDKTINKKYYSRQSYSIPERCIKSNPEQSGVPINCAGFRYRDHTTVLPGVEWEPPEK